MATLNWEISDTDAALIRKIADRAMAEMSSLRANRITHLDVTMSVQACHANGNPLDLRRLLEDFPLFDFSHDIAGIIGHLNHDTGKLENFFSPRCTLRHQPDQLVVEQGEPDIIRQIRLDYAETLIERAKSVD
jgi:hypothetical protein